MMLLLAVFVAVVSGQGTEVQSLSVNGRGATFPQPIYSGALRLLRHARVGLGDQANEWIFAYSLLKPNVKITYLPTGSGDGRTSVINRLVDFGGSDAPASNAEKASAPDLQLYPMLGAAIVPVYNLADLDFLGRGERLVFSRTVLARIFSGQITRWNDAAIAALQTPTIAAKLPAATITVILRADSSGTSNIFSSALSAFDPSFRAMIGTVNLWPPQYLNGTVSNFVISSGSGGVIASVTLLPRSITYSSLGNTRNIALPYASLINRAGNTINAAEQENVEPALEQAQLAADFTATAVDSAQPNAWPICGFTYIVLRTDINVGCDSRREMMRFFNWASTDQNPVKRAQAQGYASLPETMQSLLIGKLRNVSCAGVRLLDPIYVDQHTGPQYIAVIVIGSVACAFACTLLALSLLRPKLTSTEVIFLSIMFFGGFLVFAAMVMWYLVPRNTSICQARQWLTFGGAALMLGSLFSRLFQIHQIWRSYVIKVERLGPSIVQLMYWLSLGIVVAVQIIVLIVWSAVDPFSSISTPVNQLDVTVAYQCSSRNIWVWMGLEIAFSALLLLWGMYLLYRTWDIKQEVGESRWLLIAVYNVVIAIAIIVPLSVISPNEETWGQVGSWGCLVVAASTLWLVLVPQAGAYIRGRKAKSSPPTETAGPTLSLDMDDTHSARNSTSASHEEADVPDDVRELMEVARRLQRQKDISEQMLREDRTRDRARVGVVPVNNIALDQHMEEEEDDDAVTDGKSHGGGKRLSNDFELDVLKL